MSIAVTTLSILIFVYRCFNHISLEDKREAEGGRMALIRCRVRSGRSAATGEEEERGGPIESNINKTTHTHTGGKVLATRWNGACVVT